jgi:hypothetical protein
VARLAPQQQCKVAVTVGPVSAEETREGKTRNTQTACPRRPRASWEAPVRPYGSQKARGAWQTKDQADLGPPQRQNDGVTCAIRLGRMPLKRSQARAPQRRRSNSPSVAARRRAHHLPLEWPRHGRVLRRKSSRQARIWLRNEVLPERSRKEISSLQRARIKQKYLTIQKLLSMRRCANEIHTDKPRFAEASRKRGASGSLAHPKSAI